MVRITHTQAYYLSIVTHQSGSKTSPQANGINITQKKTRCEGLCNRMNLKNTLLVLTIYRLSFLWKIQKCTLWRKLQKTYTLIISHASMHNRKSNSHGGQPKRLHKRCKQSNTDIFWDQTFLRFPHHLNCQSALQLSVDYGVSSQLIR